jgi:hypothetical protein
MASQEGQNSMEKQVYLREGSECIGPFRALEDALRFLLLMALSGESLAGIEILHVRSAACSLLQGNDRIGHSNRFIGIATPR